MKKLTHSNIGILSMILTLAIVFTPISSAGAEKRVHSVYFENTDYELSVYKIFGSNPGKTLMLIGGIQGDEPGGFLSADLYADISLAKGNLIVVPRANFQSIVLKLRKINEDMNRKFAEDRKSNYEAKIVVILKKLISESDVLLNLHDGSGFYSEKWESDSRNPNRYGQSIIADADVYVDPKTKKEIYLGDMARTAIKKINESIKNPLHHFHFNNHKTNETSSLHKEQRKSATFFALYSYSIPAFGVETHRGLPLEEKVRQHNVAINAFMEIFDIVPELPGVNLEKPKLYYLVIAVNDLPLVVKDQQTLHVNKGDMLEISHIEANYKRGLTADIVGLGTINDARKEFRILNPTRIVVRKDYYPSGSVNIAIGEKTSLMAQGVSLSGKVKASPNVKAFKTRINGIEHVFNNYGTANLVKGDKFQITDVVAEHVAPADLVVNFKGFVGDPTNNTGEDRGFVIDTAKPLLKRYSLDKKGKQYQVVVTHKDKNMGRLLVNLSDPPAAQN
ncbi:MAG: M14/M99 family metallopeptidase [Desulfobacterales bacterium]|nr:M14/M99 family metallopeptidase [Desulfobacterales bacterium]